MKLIPTTRYMIGTFSTMLLFASCSSQGEKPASPSGEKVSGNMVAKNLSTGSSKSVSLELQFHGCKAHQ